MNSLVRILKVGGVGAVVVFALTMIAQMVAPKIGAKKNFIEDTSPKGLAFMVAYGVALTVALDKAQKMAGVSASDVKLS